MLYRVNDAFCLWPEIALVKIETIAENLSLKFLNAVGSILNPNLLGFYDVFKFYFNVSNTFSLCTVSYM